MNKPKYTIGDEAYYLHAIGIVKNTVRAVRQYSGVGYQYQSDNTLGTDTWMSEQYLFPTAEACIEFAKESAKEFMPTKGSNSPLEAPKTEEPVKFKVGDRVEVGRGMGMGSFEERMLAGKIFTVSSIVGNTIKLRETHWSFHPDWLIPIPKRGRPRKVIS